MSVSRQERKIVTALFCDLVGFTSQAEEMDPEDDFYAKNRFYENASLTLIRRRGISKRK